MARINWERIKKQYLSEYEETGVDVKTFCVRNGLVYSTARKYLNNKLLQRKENKPSEQNANNEEVQAKNYNPKGSHRPKPKSNARKPRINQVLKMDTVAVELALALQREIATLSCMA